MPKRVQSKAVMENEQEVRVPSHYLPEMKEALENEAKEKVQVDDPDVKNALRAGLRTLERAGKIIGKVEAVRKQNLTDSHLSTLSDLGIRVQNFEYGTQKLDELYNLAYQGEEKVRKVARKLDQDINTEITKTAVKGPFAKETRDYVKSLPQEERTSFIMERINHQDWDSVEAILGTDKPFLTGLTPEMLKEMKEHYKRNRYADKIKTRDMLNKVAQKIGKGYQAALENFEVLESTEVKRAIAKRNADRKMMEDV